MLHTNTEAMVAVAITSPLTMIASDAYWEDGTGHPRTTGTYSRVLGRYVARRRLSDVDGCDSKNDAHARGTPAGESTAMKAKGRLRVGADADITVFDAARVIDRSTYRGPRHVACRHSARDRQRRAGCVTTGQLVDGAGSRAGGSGRSSRNRGAP